MIRANNALAVPGVSVCAGLANRRLQPLGHVSAGLNPRKLLACKHLARQPPIRATRYRRAQMRNDTAQDPAQ